MQKQHDDLKTVRILISSPGDVAGERERARQIIESLRRRYARRFVLRHLLWEDLPLQSHTSFQEGIDLVLSQDGGVDIGIFILWSRLGSPLGSEITRPDGRAYRSGTEREFELLMRARECARAKAPASIEDVKPAVLVYRRDDDNGFHENLRGRPTQEQADLILQKQLVEDFFAEEFKDPETGVNQRAYHSYERLDVFSLKLRTHLQSLLDRMAEGQPRQTAWDPQTQGAPFMGLAAFQQRHADVFFGREEEILEARRALREQARNGCAFLLLCGASGSGKSSMACAGILPAIVENELDEQVAEWRTIVLAPSDLAPDPLTALVSRLNADTVLPELLAGTSQQDFVDVLRREPAAACKLQLKAAFGRAADKRGPVRLLIVIDQLEELFTSSTIGPLERGQVLSALEAMARSGSVWVLATIRADFYQLVQNEPGLVRMKAGAGQLDVLPPSADALRRLVEEPAHQAGLHFETRVDGQSLSDLILRDAAEHPELLPLLEDLLRELYERRDGSKLTFAAYAQLGNSVEAALSQRANRVYNALPADAQASLDSVLQALVTLGQSDHPDEQNEVSVLASDEQVVRQRALLSAFPEGSPARRLIDAFVAERLFTTGRHPETNDATVTVAHESLLRIWPKAVDWAQKNRSFLRTRAHVAWRMKEGSPLPEGDPLFTAAKDHLTRDPGGYPPPVREYVEREVRKADEDRRRVEEARIRTRRLVYGAAAVGALLLLISIGVGLFSTYRASRAREQDALAGQLVAEAERNLSQRDFARGEIAAAKALTHRDSPETRALLVNARSGGVTFISRRSAPASHPSLSVVSADGRIEAQAIPGDSGDLVSVRISETASQQEAWRVLLPKGAGLPDTILISDPAAAGTRQIAIAWPVEVPSTGARTYHVGISALTQGRPAEALREFEIPNSASGRHTQRVSSLAFHPLQPWIVTAGEDRKLCLWDYSAARPLLMWEQGDTHDTAVHGVAFDRTGALLASGGGDYLVKIWRTSDMVAVFESRRVDAQSAAAVRQVFPVNKLSGHTDSVFAVAFSPDGERLASAGYDRIVRIWNLQLLDKGQPATVGTLSGHTGTVVTLAFGADSRLLASAGKDETVRLWDVSEGRLLVKISPDNGIVRSVSFLNFEDDLRVGGEKGASTWAVRGREVSARLWNGGSTVGAVAFDPSGTQLAAAGNDGKVRVWDAQYRSQIFDPGEPDAINGIAFSPDGRWLAAAGEKRIVHVWDRANGSTKVAPGTEGVLRHEGPVWGLCFDSGGQWLASSNTDDNKRIRRWNVSDWSLRDQSEALSHTVYSLACAPGGEWLISGDANGRVAVRETKGLARVAEVTNVHYGEANVWSVAVADSPLDILSGNSDGRVRLWRANGPTWSADNAKAWTVAATSDADAAVNHTINSVSYSRKRGWVAAGGDGESVELYDRALKRVRSLRDHDGTVWFVSFDPGGSRLAYGGTDRILRLFDLDVIDRNLAVDTPAALYQESETKTGLTVKDGKIVPLLPAEDLRR